jgi:acyl-homoserine lactone acylase PvdQ
MAQGNPMTKYAWSLAAALACSCTGKQTAEKPSPQVQAWQARAAGVTIVRDDWGIAHVHGRTDADAVFGMMYAQAEDDFNRVETNLINAMGRLAEAEGEGEIYRDLRMKLFISPAQLQREYAASPDWLKALMDAWADGLNYYLSTHPAVKPRVLTRFLPWMALAFSEGSIGGDIERVNLDQLKAFYGAGPKTEAAAAPMPPLVEPTGSNGLAIAPANSTSGKALLWINPHTSFFFRSEQQVVSDEGLNVYGASTWGQFFIYQGFNERAGWMHTSSGVDNIDEYLETVVKKGDGFYYKYGGTERPLQATRIVVPYKSAAGLLQREFTVYRTHHGPIVREADGKWVSVRLMEEPRKALMQSFARTKARSLKEFRAVMELHANSTNNTVYADADGNIAYFHANFIPKRDERFDWTKPVDGSDPATEWGAPLSVEQSPLVINPSTGFVLNTNNWPFSAAGSASPKQKDFPKYVESGTENPRGVHALRLLEQHKGFTMDSLTAAAFDSYQPEFAIQIPALLRSYDQTPASDPLKAKLAAQVALLRSWDYRWAADSVACTLAVLWGDALFQRSTADARKAGVSVYEYMATMLTAQQRLAALAEVSDQLQADFGSWQTPWGQKNRFQRISSAIASSFDDAAPSIPVPFPSARWGSLASFGAQPEKGSKKLYGTAGNSFVAVVEFGDKVKARAVSAGGQSGDPRSKHFSDQAARYAAGSLREVYFYPQQLQGHIEKQYHPGQ